MVNEKFESELYEYGKQLGLIWGQELSEIFKNREIPAQPILIKLPIEKIAMYTKFSMPMQKRLYMTLGSESLGVAGNTIITGSAVLTCGLSGIACSATSNPTAQGFYGMSCVFSTVSAVSGSATVLACKCEISEVALLTETFGAAFLYLENKAHAAALRVEGKPVPARYRRPLAGFGLYNRRNNVGFITPFRSSRIIETIPFEQIGRTVGFSVSIYCYGRILLSGYRYGQQLIVKYKKNKNKKFLKSTKLFTSLISVYIQSAKRRRLYHFVVS